MEVLHQRTLCEKRQAEAQALQEMKTDGVQEPLIRHSEERLGEMDQVIEKAREHCTEN